MLLATDLDFEELGERVHHGDANSVQATRDLVRSLVELAAGVQLGEDHFCGGDTFGGVYLGGNPATVILDGNTSFDVDGHGYAIAEASKCLVNRVVDHLEYEVMETTLGGVADVHSRALADGFESLEHPN